MSGDSKPKPGPKPAPAKETEGKVIPLVTTEQPEVQEPEIALGRIVRYVTGAGTVRPAIVTRVNEDESVDLTVFNSEGAVPVENVIGDPGGDYPGTWHWPSIN